VNLHRVNVGGYRDPETFRSARVADEHHRPRNKFSDGSAFLFAERTFEVVHVGTSSNLATTLPFSGVFPSVSGDQVRCNGGFGSDRSTITLRPNEIAILVWMKPHWHFVSDSVTPRGWPARRRLNAWLDGR
jgi:hypothetical protein